MTNTALLARSHAMVRLLVRFNGHQNPFRALSVDISNPLYSFNRERVIFAAAEKLGFLGTYKCSGVRIYLEGGAEIDDVALLTKDDVLFFAFDGGNWRQPIDETKTQPLVTIPLDAEAESSSSGARAVSKRAHDTLVGAFSEDDEEEDEDASAADGTVLRVPRPDELKVGSRVLVLRGMVRYVEGRITSIEATYPPTGQWYSGELIGHNRQRGTFRCLIHELRINANEPGELRAMIGDMAIGHAHGPMIGAAAARASPADRIRDKDRPSELEARVAALSTL